MIPALNAWRDFYVVAGAAAGALIGLQFVVVTLIADMPAPQDLERASAAFSSPTIVHLSTALLLAATGSAPWNSVAALGWAWGVIGVAGLVYAGMVVRRIGAQTAYRPEPDDWAYYAVLPVAAYAALVVAAGLSPGQGRAALYLAAAATLALLFLGVRNAWDTVTFHMFSRRRDQPDGRKS
ncbi:MAG: hypothetical protein ACRD1Y_01295 [Terriglobales bacterium]